MLSDYWIVKPTVLIIFGATGDLARKKIYSALYELFIKGVLNERVKIIGTGRSAFNNESFRNLVSSSIAYEKIDYAKMFSFLSKFTYIQGEINEVVPKIRGVVLDDEQAIFYFAIKPSLFETALREISVAGLTHLGNNPSRFLFEKPFGEDYHSAVKLNKTIHSYVEEDCVFRIDHYLAKELIQNMLILRFSNDILDNILSKHFISNIQLTVSEDIGVEGRGDYFDNAGIVRDMFQNHILQTLSLILMEKPSNLGSVEVSHEKLKVLKLIRVWDNDYSEKTLVRAQYETGFVNGRRVVSFTEEKNVNPCSSTESFFAGAFECLTPRWQGVPILVRVGKRLPKREGIVSFIFKDSLGVSTDFKILRSFFSPSALRIRFQPNETITLQVFLKTYGSEFREQAARLSLNLPDFFDKAFSDAYSRVLFDAFRGDRLLFATADEVLQSWLVVDGILDIFKRNLIPLRKYAAGSWGPKEAELLPKRLNINWENL